MTYKETYYKIIQHRQANPLEDGVYGEKHHIYPKSLFPQFARAAWNIVKLLPQEHYQCHYLLTKWFEESGERLAYEKMVCAWYQMTHTRNGLVVNAEQYAELKEKYRDVRCNSEKFKEMSMKALKKAQEAAWKSEKHKEAVRQNMLKAQKASHTEKNKEAIRKSEKHKEAVRRNIKKATEASLKSEKHKEAAKQNVKKANEARRKHFEIDGIVFERLLDASKHFGVGQTTISKWLRGKLKTSHICKYI